jgi:hypothetical protein
MNNQIISLNQSSLVNFIRCEAMKIPDSRKSNKEISIADAVMSAFAIFSLKIPSLLQFDKNYRKSPNANNLKALFGIERIPSDTQMREILDNIHPDFFKNIYPKILKNLQRQKKLEAYEFMRINNEPHYLAPFDGSDHFRSQKIHGPCCTKAKLSNNKFNYYHKVLASSIVSPDLKTVIPFAPEEMVNQDGDKKQDSEHKAFRRSFGFFKKAHPRMKIIVCGDSLFASAPMVEVMLKEKMSFILTVKDDLHVYLFDFIKLREERKLVEILKTEEVIGEKVKKKIERTYRFVNGVPLNKGSSNDLEVNFVELIEKTTWISMKGEYHEKINRWCFVTNIRLTKDNIEKIVIGGRTRWKIENEVFNTLKNKGYHFEHNYGHGKKYLSSNFTQIMMLAFLVDQILEMSDKIFMKVLRLSKKKLYFWSKLKSIYEMFNINSWENYYEIALASFGPGIDFKDTT